MAKPASEPRPEVSIVQGDVDGLAADLCRAAADVIVDKGLGSFSLREVARRAGVSHAAPAYHFGDTTGLLTAVAVQGLLSLERATRSAAESVDDPAEKIAAVGRAYVHVALTNPGHCEVIWRSDLVNTEGSDYAEAGQAAFGVLIETIEALAAAYNPDLPVLETAFAHWSAVQGQVVLHDKLTRFAGLDDRDPIAVAIERTDRLTRILLDGIEAGAASARFSTLES